MNRRYHFAPELAGLLAECEGGQAVAGDVGAREFFRGRLTGLSYEEGDPPWRWYAMSALEAKPQDYADGTVWCEEGFLFMLESRDPASGAVVRRPEAERREYSKPV